MTGTGLDLQVVSASTPPAHPHASTGLKQPTPSIFKNERNNSIYKKDPVKQ
jgi:hypothetical protein